MFILVIYENTGMVQSGQWWKNVKNTCTLNTQYNNCFAFLYIVKCDSLYGWEPQTTAKHGLEIKADSTHAGSSGSIPGAGKKTIDIRMGVHTEVSCAIAPYGQG